MSDTRNASKFARLLGSAGRAHHEAVGGPNPGWPQWYAKFLVDNDIADHVGFQPTVDEVADWLKRADAMHRAEAPEQPWPPYYAEVILDDLDEDPRTTQGA